LCSKTNNSPNKQLPKSDLDVLGQSAGEQGVGMPAEEEHFENTELSGARRGELKLAGSRNIQLTVTADGG
jgi:hypothetical protein